MTDRPSQDDDVRPRVESDPPAEQPPSEEILELDHIYEALAHPRRRYLCYTLLEDTEWSLTELATKVTAWENNSPEHAVTPEQRNRVYVALYHAHVPKLADEGVISFDEATERIVAAEHAEQVLSVLSGMGATLNMSQESHARSEIDDEDGRSGY